MPISFEQPGPYDAGISSAYGAAQAMRDFAPFLSRAYGGGGGGGGGVAAPPDLSGGGRYGGGGGGGGGQILQEQLSPLALYQGKEEIDRYFNRADQQQAIQQIQGQTASGDVSDLDAQIAPLQQQQEASDTMQNYDEAGTGYVPGTAPEEAAGAPPTVDEAGTGQAGVSSPGQAGPNIAGAQPPPDFTQSDALRLQRLQASRSRVQEELANGAIDPRTAQRMIQQLQIPLGALRQQQQAAQTQAMQQQVAQMQHQNAMQTSMRNMDASHFAQMIQRQTHTLPDGTRIFISPIDGKAHIIAPAKPPTDRHEITPQHMSTISRHVASMIQHEEDRVAKDPLAQKPEWMKTEEGKRRHHEELLRREIAIARGDVGVSEPSRPPPTPQQQQAAIAELRPLLGLVSRQPPTAPPIRNPYQPSTWR